MSTLVITELVYFNQCW